MKKIFLSLAAVSLLALPLLAQQPKGKTLAEVLGLNADQKKKIEAIDKKYLPKVKSIGDKYKPQVAPLEQQMAALRKEFEAKAKPIQEKAVALQKKANLELEPVMTARRKEVEAILTPAQREKVKKLDAERAKQIQQLMDRMKGQQGGKK
jgi:ABC-type uncharacterized transport system substrate-binding protein